MLLRYVPRVARRALCTFVPTLEHKHYMLKKARHHNTGRPLGDIFSEIYARNLWGGKEGEFYSGPGSDDNLFADVVNKFVDEHAIRSIVDCGCGDFRFGRKIARRGIKYIGIDIVPALVERNQTMFGNDNVSFLLRDLTRDDLPAGDLCIVREVLQHLSNDHISTILPKLPLSFRHAIVAEGHPAPKQFRMANLDKPAGDDVRVRFGSGVYLDKSPFALPNTKILAQLPLPRATRGQLLTIYVVEGAFG